MGQDTSWDQKNYHFYTVHAWLSGRTFSDLAPAQIQTWLNPLPHLLQYLLIQTARPVVAGLVMGALAGLNGLMLWLLARRLQRGDPTWETRACASFIVLVGLTGSIFLSEVGTTQAEYLCSVFVLGGLISITPASSEMACKPKARDFLFAGLWMGTACGLKLTNLIYAIGLGASLLALWPVLALHGRLLLSYTIGGVCGFLATGGYWAVHLWLVFGNPIFPFFNAVFASPLFERINFVDTIFIPKSLFTAAITYPFGWLLGMHPTNQLPFREARFALVAVFMPVALIVSALRPARGPLGAAENGSNVELRQFWLHGLFFVVSYAIWLKQFGHQRYALPLELLTGLMLFQSVDQVLRSRREVTFVFGLLAVFIVVWTRPANWGRIPYGKDWFGIAAPRDTAPPTLYVMIGDREPFAYVIPFMPQTSRFVRLTGNMPLEPSMPLGRKALSMIRAHTGTIRSLTVLELDEQQRARLARFGLAFAPEGKCQQFRSRVDIFSTCILVKTSLPYVDFDSDGRSDITVYRDGAWFVLRSSDGGMIFKRWGGMAQDIPVPGDYDGDGKTDLAVYRDGAWLIIRSLDGKQTTVGWGGAAQDIPVPGDYDGDGKTDLAVYRDGAWLIIRSLDGKQTTVGWGGAAQDIPVPADYDGDGKTDLAVYRDGAWSILRSSDDEKTSVGWGGLIPDVPVPADYDGDGKTDAAVYRNGVWFIKRSSDGGGNKVGWEGTSQEVPVPADYDGDRKADITVYRDGIWLIRRSSDDTQLAVHWGGLPQDIPLNRTLKP